MKKLLILCVLIVSGCEYLFDSTYDCTVLQDCTTKEKHGHVTTWTYICDEDCRDYQQQLQIKAKGYDEADAECLESIGGVEYRFRCNFSCACLKAKGVFPY